MTAEKTVKVKVIGNWRVVTDDGTGYVGGDTLDVDEDTAREWVDAGWVEAAKPAAKTAPRKRS